MSSDRNGTEVAVGDVIEVGGGDTRTVVAVAPAGVYVIKQRPVSSLVGQPQFLRDDDGCYVLHQRAAPVERYIETTSIDLYTETWCATHPGQGYVVGEECPMCVE